MRSIKENLRHITRHYGTGESLLDAGRSYALMDTPLDHEAAQRHLSRGLGTSTPFMEYNTAQGLKDSRVAFLNSAFYGYGKKPEASISLSGLLVGKGTPLGSRFHHRNGKDTRYVVRLGEHLDKVMRTKGLIGERANGRRIDYPKCDLVVTGWSHEWKDGCLSVVAKNAIPYRDLKKTGGIGLLDLDPWTGFMKDGLPGENGSGEIDLSLDEGPGVSRILLSGDYLFTNRDASPGDVLEPPRQRPCIAGSTVNKNRRSAIGSMLNEINRRANGDGVYNLLMATD